MKNFFTVKPETTKVDLKDAIYSHLNKSKAILTTTMFAIEFIRDDMTLDNHTLYNALWAVDDYLEELDLLFQRLEALH